MKKTITILCLMSGVALSNATLVAYWNFNDTSFPAPSSGAATLDLGASGARQSSGSGTTQNALNSDPGLKTLLIDGANGQSIVFSMSMSSLQNLVLSYATLRSSTGFNEQDWSYSTDGTSFAQFATVSGDILIPPSGSPTSSAYSVDTVNFSSATALNNNSLIWIKLTLNGGSGGSDRLDNIQFNADPSLVPEPAWGMASSMGLLALCGLRQWRLWRQGSAGVG